MTEAVLIIDGRKKGLRHASGYYSAFPREPSPFGELTFNPDLIIDMGANSSLYAALPAMNRAGAHGAVVLVCHAHPDGLTLPIAPGAENSHIDGPAIAIMASLVEAESALARLRLMPAATSDERTAVLKAWMNLLNALQTGLGDVDQNAPNVDAMLEAMDKAPRSTDEERKALMAKWTALLNRLKKRLGDALADEPDARTRFFLWAAQGKYDRKLEEFRAALRFQTVAQVRGLSDRIRGVRAMYIDRLELRACNVGQDTDVLKQLLQLLNIAKASAPTVETFFGWVAVGVESLHVERTPAPRGNSRAPTATGRRPTADPRSADAVLRGPSTRGFVRDDSLYFYARSGLRGASERFERYRDTDFYPDELGGRLDVHAAFLNPFKFVLQVLRRDPKTFEYKIAAWVVQPRASRHPEPETINAFAREAFDAATTFNLEALPVMGLWTPDSGRLPWAHPRERRYLELIATAQNSGRAAPAPSP